MNKKHNLLLILLWCLYLPLMAQRSPAFKSNKDRNSFIPETGTLFLKAGLSNLLHPTSPSLDLGFEIRLNKRFSISGIYGLRSPQISYPFLKDRLYFDNYFKLFGEIKYYIGRSDRKFWNFEPQFIAIEGYFLKGMTQADSNYALDLNNNIRLSYVSAGVDKWTHGLNLKTGYFWDVNKYLALEISYGVGILFFKRNYVSIVNPIFSNEFFDTNEIDPYDDRVIGQQEFLNFIVNLKLSYRIF